MKEFVHRIINEPATVRKFFVALVTVIGILLAQGVFNDQWESWAVTLLAVANAFGVYAVGNAKSSVSAQGRIAPFVRNERGSIGVGEAIVFLVVVILILVIVGVI